MSRSHHFKRSYTGRVSPEEEYSSEGEVNVLEDPVEGGKGWIGTNVPVSPIPNIQDQQVGGIYPVSHTFSIETNSVE